MSCNFGGKEIVPYGIANYKRKLEIGAYFMQNFLGMTTLGVYLRSSKTGSCFNTRLIAAFAFKSNACICNVVNFDMVLTNFEAALADSISFTPAIHILIHCKHRGEVR